MGLFGTFGGSGGLSSIAASISPKTLLGTNAPSLTGNVQSALGGAAQKGMANLLGTDPTSPCPGTAGGNGGGIGSANDPCGKGDDALKSALLGLGMKAAQPSIAAISGEIGGAMDSDLGALSSTLGNGVMTTATGLGGAMGLDPSSPAQSAITKALGTGSMVALGGGDTTSSAIGAITGASTSIAETNKSNKPIDSTNLFSKIKSTSGFV